jgi:hypothetical protein
LTYEHDIALIRLKIQFNAHIKPICLMTTNGDMTDGFVAGWSDKDYQETFNEIAVNTKLRAVNLLECLEKEPFLKSRLIGFKNSSDYFCAERIDKDNTDFFKIEVGTGFYFNINGINYLKGVASSPYKEQFTEYPITVYSDISNHYDFIKVRQDQRF